MQINTDNPLRLKAAHVTSDHARRSAAKHNAKRKAQRPLRPKAAFTPQTIDLTGQKFHDWQVLGYVGSRGTSGAVWKCRCACGFEKDLYSHALRKGETRSCRDCSHKRRYDRTLQPRALPTATPETLSEIDLDLQRFKAWQRGELAMPTTDVRDGFVTKEERNL